jgi:hypothetical protein
MTSLDFIRFATLFVFGWNISNLYRQHPDNRRGVATIAVCFLIYVVVVNLR